MDDDFRDDVRLQMQELPDILFEHDSYRQSIITDKLYKCFDNSDFVKEGYEKYIRYWWRQTAPDINSEYWKNVGRQLRSFVNLESAQSYGDWIEFNRYGMRTLDLSTVMHMKMAGSPLQRSWSPVYLRPKG